MLECSPVSRFTPGQEASLGQVTTLTAASFLNVFNAYIFCKMLNKINLDLKNFSRKIFKQILTDFLNKQRYLWLAPCPTVNMLKITWKFYVQSFFYPKLLNSTFSKKMLTLNKFRKLIAINSHLYLRLAPCPSVNRLCITQTGYPVTSFPSIKWSIFLKKSSIIFINLLFFLTKHSWWLGEAVRSRDTSSRVRNSVSIASQCHNRQRCISMALALYVILYRSYSYEHIVRRLLLFTVDC